MIARWLLFAAGFAGSIIGCTSRDRRPGGALRSGSKNPTTASESVVVGVSVPKVLPSVSPHAVQWDAGAVADRLRSVGFAVRFDPTPVTEPFLRPTGTRMIVHSSPTDSAEVLAFFYAGPIEAGSDVMALDTETVSPKHMKAAWRAPAALVTDNNLVVIVLAESAEVRRRVSRALRLSAGP